MSPPCLSKKPHFLSPTFPLSASPLGNKECSSFLDHPVIRCAFIWCRTLRSCHKTCSTYAKQRSCNVWQSLRFTSKELIRAPNICRRHDPRSKIHDTCSDYKDNQANVGFENPEYVTLVFGLGIIFGWSRSTTGSYFWKGFAMIFAKGLQSFEWEDWGEFEVGREDWRALQTLCNPSGFPVDFFWFTAPTLRPLSFCLPALSAICH